MRIYTACAACGELLVYIDRHHLTHLGCDAPHDYAADMERRFLAAAEAGDDAEADRLAQLLDHLDDAPPRLLDAALIYASWGWPVFPLRPGSKEPATAHGFKDATTDPDVIRAWWKSRPKANIGLPTGIRFDVLDIDCPAGAPAWLALKDTPAMPTAHGLALTRSNGLHVFLPPSGGGNLARAGQVPGIDYRGTGGYVVAAPSVVDGDERYPYPGRFTWIAKPSPALTELEVAA